MALHKSGFTGFTNNTPNSDRANWQRISVLFTDRVLGSVIITQQLEIALT